jgi:hypothetical protein
VWGLGLSPLAILGEDVQIPPTRQSLGGRLVWMGPIAEPGLNGRKMLGDYLILRHRGGVWSCKQKGRGDQPRVVVHLGFLSTDGNPVAALKLRAR